MDKVARKKLKPSEFMRELRPEYYSDSTNQSAYILDRAVFEHHLETVTQRNETHEFEIFCLKLCERVICPNLRPQTGSEGGGDSKADSETVPVAKEIQDRVYIGEQNAGNERWAFAFSAQKSWKSKVRGDVEGIVGTERNYKKIINVTSRAARAKDRAKLEDDLTNEFGVEIKILDRSWIVKNIIEDNRKDIAFEYLGIGQVNEDAARTGPEDYARNQRLQEIDKALSDPEAFKNAETQMVTEALVAAKLSRNAEHPRIDTDGRFQRAIRLAKEHGTERQIISAEYENLWTAFWWFDEVDFINENYDRFEMLVIDSVHAQNVELLGNIHQLLINAIVHKHLTTDECKLAARTARLSEALTLLVEDKSRPNNALEAEASLLFLRMGRLTLEKGKSDLVPIWTSLADILERAKSLGEFSAERLVLVIEGYGRFVGDDPAYNELTEKLAEFVSERKGEAEGGLVLLRRAQNLSFENHFDMIRLLGKAAGQLTKREYNDQLIEAMWLLSLAYRSAGLLWAARASTNFALAALIIEGEADSDLRAEVIPTSKILAWISLELGHLPDIINSMRFFAICANGMPLAEESKTKVLQDLNDFELAFGSSLLNCDGSDLAKLSPLPDLLESIGLFGARTALLYALGHEHILREDGSIPKSESQESIAEFFSSYRSQILSEMKINPLIFNEGQIEKYRTLILGMSITVEFDCNDIIIPLAEMILGSLEAFFATAIERKLTPHTEAFSIIIHGSDEISKPEISVQMDDMSATVMWPNNIPANSFDNQEIVQRFLIELSGRVMASTCFCKDMKGEVETLFKSEAVSQRVSMICVATNSYNRVFGKSYSKLSDWSDQVDQVYELKSDRPNIVVLPLKTRSETPEKEMSMAGSHREIEVRSIVDMHLWEQAIWRGTGYIGVLPPGPAEPPTMALMFENEEAACKIFERWLDRFGREDVEEQIYVAVIQEINPANAAHYSVMITSAPRTEPNPTGNKILTMAAKVNRMEPANTENLDRFLTDFERMSAYFLVPAIPDPETGFRPLYDMGILKRSLVIKKASEVGKNDIEQMALGR